MVGSRIRDGCTRRIAWMDADFRNFPAFWVEIFQELRLIFQQISGIPGTSSGKKYGKQNEIRKSEKLGTSGNPFHERIRAHFGGELRSWGGIRVENFPDFNLPAFLYEGLLENFSD